MSDSYKTKERNQRGEIIMSYRIACTEAEWAIITEAAHDAHMQPHEYARLMILCAAGMGGVLEHLERASEASALVDKVPGYTIRITPTGEKP